MSFEPAPAKLPKWLPVDYRTASRYLSGAIVGLREGNKHPQYVQLFDVSALGCRIEKPEDSLVGKSVTVCFAADVEAAGWIVWRDGNQCGVDFAKALTEDQVGRVAKPQSTI